MAGRIPATALAEVDAPPAEAAAAQEQARVLAAAPACGLAQLPTLADWLRDGPFTLALASSFFGFYHHAGALQGAFLLLIPASRSSGCLTMFALPAALAEAGIAPARVSGSSSGAIVASLYVRAPAAGASAHHQQRLGNDN